MEFTDTVRQLLLGQALNLQMVLTLILIGLGIFLATYIKKKAETLATREDQERLALQLQRNTESVEEIKTRYLGRAWVGQQVWLRKQAAYDNVFKLLLTIKKYVSSEASEFEESEWFDFHLAAYESAPGVSQWKLKRWQEEREQYQKRKESGLPRVQSERLKGESERAFDELVELLKSHSVYLRPEVAAEVATLKRELHTSSDDEDIEQHFERIKGATENAWERIRQLATDELELGIPARDRRT